MNNVGQRDQNRWQTSDTLDQWFSTACYGPEKIYIMIYNSVKIMKNSIKSYELAMNVIL